MQNKLNNYLALTGSLGAASLASSANAAITAIDISSFSGINAGLSNNTQASYVVSDSNGTTIFSAAFNNNVSFTYAYYGTDYDSRFGFVSENADNNFFTDGEYMPTKFANGDIIDPTVSSVNNGTSLFNGNNTGEGKQGTSPDFGPNEYVGFVTSNNQAGYLEVTWDSAAQEFEVISGAYETLANTPIAAGAQPVPEPSALALLSLGALGISRRRRRAA